MVWVIVYFVEIEVMLDFLDLAVVVSEEAALSVGTVQLSHKGVASLRLVLNIYRLSFVDEFVFAMSKLAFVSVPAHAYFDPILAKLSLELCPICFFSLCSTFSAVEGLLLKLCCCLQVLQVIAIPL
jgi:hypothetical protein